MCVQLLAKSRRGHWIPQGKLWVIVTHYRVLETEPGSQQSRVFSALREIQAQFPAPCNG